MMNVSDSAHSVVKSRIYSHRKNISSNHLSRKNVAFTIFLPKMHESKFPKLALCSSPHTVEKPKIPCHVIIFPSNQFRVKLFSKTLISRNFCNNIVAAKFRDFHTVFCNLSQSQVKSSVIKFLSKV